MVARQAFVVLAMHAKMHQQLDALHVMQARLGETVSRIERAEIKAYADDSEYQKLENLKKEVLAIRFLE